MQAYKDVCRGADFEAKEKGILMWGEIKKARLFLNGKVGGLFTFQQKGSSFCGIS